MKLCLAFRQVFAFFLPKNVFSCVEDKKIEHVSATNSFRMSVYYRYTDKTPQRPKSIGESKILLFGEMWYDHGSRLAEKWCLEECKRADDWNVAIEKKLVTNDFDVLSTLTFNFKSIQKLVLCAKPWQSRKLQFFRRIIDKDANEQFTQLDDVDNFLIPDFRQEEWDWIQCCTMTIGRRG